MKPLQGMSEIIRSAEVEIFCLQHGLYQVEVDLVESILQSQNIHTEDTKHIYTET